MDRSVTDAPRQLPYCAILTIAFSFNSTLAAIAHFVILRLWRVPVNIPGREKLIGITMGAFLAAYSYASSAPSSICRCVNSSPAKAGATPKDRYSLKAGDGVINRRPNYWTMCRCVRFPPRFCHLPS